MKDPQVREILKNIRLNMEDWFKQMEEKAEKEKCIFEQMQENYDAENIAFLTGFQVATVREWLEKHPEAVDEIKEIKPDKLTIAGAIITDRSLKSWIEISEAGK